MPYTYTCLQCGKSVTTPDKRHTKFCSKPCNYAYKRVQKTCVICGQPFEVKKSEIDKLVTCRSEECKKATKTGEHNPFHGRNHDEKAKSKISKANSKPHTEVECACGCGEKFELPPHRMKRDKKTDLFFLDRSHMGKWLIGENHWNYRGGNIYYGDGWNKIAQAVRDRDKVCQMCGKTPQENGRGLDVHHKIPARVSQDNSMDNLIALCISCHQSLQVSEQLEYPIKVNKYRVCLECGKAFIPVAFQKFCSEECHRKRKRQWEKKHIATHPEAYQARRARIKKWQQANKERVNELHQQSRLRYRS
jgi:hypothetical protein